ncbi:MAG: LamG-like jellyroll fold domain-containing protein [Pseudomonadota bacterium]
MTVLLYVSAGAELTIDTKRETGYDFACVDGQGEVLSRHQRQDKAISACATRALADPEGTYRVQGGRWRIEVTGAAEAAVVVVEPPAAQGGDIALFFTDLPSGPNTGSGAYADGALITLYGKGFGATRGSGSVTLNGVAVASYAQWCEACSRTGLDMVTIQPGSGTSTGDFVVTNNLGQTSNGLAFTVDNGRNIREANGETEFASEMSAIDGNNQQDILYVRAGTYDQRYGPAFGDDLITIGGAYADVAIIGYPGETVTFNGDNVSLGGFRFNDGSGDGYADGILLANLNVIAAGSDAIYAGIGGNSGTARAAGTDRQRVVNVDARVTSLSGSQTGTLTVAGDDKVLYGSILGNDDPARTIANNTHHLYIQLGVQNVDIGWNIFENMRCGHALQVHTDGTQGGGGAWQFDNIRIHDNVFQLGDNGNSRGINLSNSWSSANFYIWNNVFDKIGGVDGSGGSAFSVINAYTGNVEIFNNTIVDATAWTPGGGAIWIRSGVTSASITNNIIGADASLEIEDWIEDETGSAVIDSNVYYGRAFTVPAGDSNAVNADPLVANVGTRGDGGWATRDYTVASGSPAIDVGRSALPLAVEYDVNGLARSEGARPDAGANESPDIVGSIQFSGTVDQDYDRFTIPLTGGSPANIGAADFTIELWINADASNTASGAAFFNGNIFFDMDRLSGNDSLVLSLHAGVPQIYVQANGSDGLANASSDVRGNWSWLVFQRSASTGAVEVWVDGTREVNTTLPAGDLSYAGGGNAKDQVIEIGGEKHNQGTPAYTGLVSEMRFSSTLRYTGNTIPVPTAPLGLDADVAAYWTLREGAGAAIYDRDTGSAAGTVVFDGGQTVPVWSTSGPYQ